jgi:hypothetical protein
VFKVSSFCESGACIWVDCDCEGAHPRTSSRSNPSGNSVEASGCETPGCRMIHVRDTKNPAPEAAIDYPITTWCGGLSMIFQLVEDIPRNYPTLGRVSSAWYKVERNGTALYFDDEERVAFLRGASLREFVPSR